MLRIRIASLLALVLATAAGCATYSDYTRAARERLSRGDFAGGEAELNRMLGVESSRELPTEWGSETALAILERATVLQAMRDYATSARDFQVADKELELLDLANDDAGTLGKYLFSDDATRYRASPTEKLLLNALNMVNYLARGDLQGAAVEARRFTVMRKYLQDYFPGTSHGAFGAYLAGFVFEKRGEWDVALRYYDEVLAEAQAPSLAEPIRRVAAQGAYRTGRIEQILAAGTAAPLGPDEGEILVVVKTGRVPAREPARLPIGAALGLAANHVSGDTTILEHGMFKVVSYPELVPRAQHFDGATLQIGASPVSLDPVTDVEAEVVREYEAARPKIVGAALTRMIARALAAEGARAAGKQHSRGLGFLAAALVEGAMVAADKPDTRSWSTLPARVHLARVRVPAGRHQVTVDLHGRGGPLRLTHEVEVPAGGFAVADFTTLR